SRLDLVYDLVQTKLDLVDRHGGQGPVRLQRTEIGWHLLDPQLFLREGDRQGLGRVRARAQEAEAAAGGGKHHADFESFGRGNKTATVHRADLLGGRTGKSSRKRGF